MSFFSADDRATRQRNQDNEQQEKERIKARAIEQSPRIARQELPAVLAAIRKTYREGASTGHSFSYMKPNDSVLREHPERDFDPITMVKELMRLVERETGLVCKFDGGPFQCGFSVDF